MVLLLRRLALALALLCVAAVAWFFARSLEVRPDPLIARGAPATASDTPVLSTQRLAAVLAAQPEPVDLGALLTTVQTDVPDQACAVITWGDSELVSIRPGAPLSPGLAQLFLTGYTALDLLGADFAYTTTALSQSRVDASGALADPLVVIGGGDPVLQTTEWALQRGQSVWTSFEVLADELAAAGVTRIDGGIVVVDERYDSERTIPGWSTDWPEARQIGALGALQVNDGIVDTELVPDPGVATVSLLADLLAERGVVTDGPLSRAQIDAPTQDEMIVLGQVTSAPLRAIVRDMWHQGDPTTAELLLKEVGLAANGTTTGGSSTAGGQAVQQAVAARGTEVALSPRDGSGLDPTAQLNCQTLSNTLSSLPAEHEAIAALAALHAPAFDGQFRSIDPATTLAIAGGGDRNARGIVGRAETSGGPLTFATLVNNADQLTPADLLFQTRVVEAVAAIAATEG